MKFGLLCKRYYTNKDLLTERFGRLYHLPAQLSRLGHKGLVLAADYRSRITSNVRTPETEFHSIPLSVLNFCTFVTETYHRFQRNRPDVLIASGDSHLGALGLLYARLFRIPFVFDIYDDYTTFASRRIPGMKKLFYYSVQKADLVVTASVPLSRRLRQFNENILIVENGTDQDLFKPIARESARSTLSINNDRPVVGFFGSITRNRGIQTLTQAISILKADYPDILLLIAGKNSSELELDEPHIDYRGMVAHQDVPLFVNSCDVAVIPYLSERQAEMTNACKIAEYLACGVPVVATRVSNHAEVFAEAPQSICEPGDPEAMALAIRSQLESPQIAGFPVDMTWENLGERLSGALEGLTATRSPSSVSPIKSC